MNQLHALAWALPTVLLLAVVVVLVLKKVLPVGAGSVNSTTATIEATSIALGDSAHAHLLRVEGRRYLVVETGSAIQIEAIDPGQTAPPAALNLFKLRK